MICSSLNLDGRIVRLPPLGGLYPILEEFWGLRSVTDNEADFPGIRVFNPLRP